MARRRGPEAHKQWVHLPDEHAHVFDQTSGLVKADEEAERTAGMTDAERLANAAVIGGIAAGIGGP